MTKNKDSKQILVYMLIPEVQISVAVPARRKREVIRRLSSNPVITSDGDNIVVAYFARGRAPAKRARLKP